VYCACSSAKRPINWFKLNQQSRQQALGAYYYNMYTVNGISYVLRNIDLSVKYQLQTVFELL
jgi:hypothetical protein